MDGMDNSRLTVDLAMAGSGRFPSILFTGLFLEWGLLGFVTEDWPVDDSSIAKACKTKGAEVLYHARGEGEKSEEILLYWDQQLVRLQLNYASLNVMVGTPTHDLTSAHATMAAVKKLFPREKPRDDNKIWMTFWSYSPKGPQAIRRKIIVPSWEEVTDNYPGATNGSLARMMTEFRPAYGGQLLLWHGAPGTGKTYALRALGREWRKWCNVEYVVDPDDFFGNASYMMQVLIRLGDDYDEDDYDDAPPAVRGKDQGRGPADGEAGEQPWTLLILEDTGELLSPDAKEKSGQGLSRFLNVTDGLIGQGLRVVLMVTTNEPLRDLHPAVKRPGRSAQAVEFKKFTQAEANTWLADKGGYSGDPVDRSGETLAEMYAKIQGYDIAKGPGAASVGLGRS